MWMDKYRTIASSKTYFQFFQLMCSQVEHEEQSWKYSCFLIHRDRPEPIVSHIQVTTNPLKVSIVFPFGSLGSVFYHLALRVWGSAMFSWYLHFFLISLYEETTLCHPFTSGWIFGLFPFFLVLWIMLTIYIQVVV